MTFRTEPRLSQEGLEPVPVWSNLEVNTNVHPHGMWSNLEVNTNVHPHESAGSPIPTFAGQTGRSESQSTMPYESRSPTYAQTQPPKHIPGEPYATDLEPVQKSGRVCGMRKSVLWLIILAGVMVVVTAVVGGVVGSRVAQQSTVAAPASNPPATSPASTRSATSSSAAASSVLPDSSTSKEQLTTTTIQIAPTQVYVSDCPSSNNTVYSIALGSKTYNYRKLCGVAVYNADAQDKANIVTNTGDLDQCIDQCTLQPQAGGLPCNAVCWRTGASPPDKAIIGSCFGYVTENTTANTFNGNFSAGFCDGAVYIGMS